jgi:hypothetical protein
MANTEWLLNIEFCEWFLEHCVQKCLLHWTQKLDACLSVPKQRHTAHVAPSNAQEFDLESEFISGVLVLLLVLFVLKAFIARISSWIWSTLKSVGREGSPLRGT